MSLERCKICDIEKDTDVVDFDDGICDDCLLNMCDEELCPDCENLIREDLLVDIYKNQTYINDEPMNSRFFININEHQLIMTEDAFTKFVESVNEANKFNINNENYGR